MLWYSLEAPQWGTSDEYLQHMFLRRNKKNIYLDTRLIWSYWSHTNWRWVYGSIYAGLLDRYLRIEFRMPQIIHAFCLPGKHPDGWVVSTPDIGSWGSGFGSPCSWNSAHDSTALHCTEPFIIILPSSPYDLDNIERDVKHQIIIIFIIRFLRIIFMHQIYGATDTDVLRILFIFFFLILKLSSAYTGIVDIEKMCYCG